VPCAKSGEFTVLNTVTNINAFSFYYCISITKVTVSQNVNFIGEKAFFNCSSLAEVYLLPSTPPFTGNHNW
jgi:hypothetical protein